MRDAYVYVMERSDGSMKIGSSMQPDRRRLELCGVRILHSVPNGNPYRVEHIAHRLLTVAGKRVKGQRECFWVSLEEAVSAIDRAERIVSGREPEPAWPVTHVAKTYRLEEPILKEMERFREDFPLGPSDTRLVNEAIRQFLDQERQRFSAASARGARR